MVSVACSIPKLQLKLTSRHILFIYIQDTPTGDETLALRKALEWELSLDSRDLRSHAWYHGPIPRQRAEEIVSREGDFLIRDCTSQPGNYVLSCKSKGPVLHFVINKVIEKLAIMI